MSRKFIGLFSPVLLRPHEHGNREPFLPPGSFSFFLSRQRNVVKRGRVRMTDGVGVPQWNEEKEENSILSRDGKQRVLWAEGMAL